MEGGKAMDDGLMIETRGLTKVFGDLVAVDAINLKVRKGTIHGFVGPNGAGKTTTIKMLIGALRCTEGDGWIKGHRMGSAKARQLIGYSPEHPCFYGDMTAFEYLVYMAKVCGVERREARTRADDLLEWLDLASFGGKKVGTFSAGMMQKLSLAQSLIHEPEAMILDEPTANMDPTGRLSILNKLKQLSQERDVTIFLSSHILSELEQIVDSLAMINKGQIVLQGDIKELRRKFSENHYLLKTTRNEAVLETLRGREWVKEGWLDTEGFVHLVIEDGAVLRRDIMNIITNEGAELVHLSEERVSLQDIYRKTIGIEEE